MTNLPWPFTSVTGIQRLVCEAYGLTHEDMLGAVRARPIARPRQIAMYLSRRYTRRSLPEIGRSFGGRDHTTVLHAVRLVEHLRSRDRALDARLREIEGLIPPLPSAEPAEEPHAV